jgi:pseudouridine-5'-phosphate glycosidase
VATALGFLLGNSLCIWRYQVYLKFQIMKSKSGLLFGVPVPEELSADGDLIERAIQLALKESREKNVAGKDVTPFVLARLASV